MLTSPVRAHFSGAEANTGGALRMLRPCKSIDTFESKAHRQATCAR